MGCLRKGAEELSLLSTCRMVAFLFVNYLDFEIINKIEDLSEFNMRTKEGAACPVSALKSW